MIPVLAVKPGLTRHSDLALFANRSLQTRLTDIAFRSDRSRMALEALAWHQLHRVVPDLALDALRPRLAGRPLSSDATWEAGIAVTAWHAWLAAWTAHSAN